MLEKQAEAQLRSFDQLVDEEFFGQDLPFAGWSEAALAILSAFEVGIGTCTPKTDPLSWGSSANSLRFALQHALSLLGRRYADRRIRQADGPISGKAITLARKVLDSASDYHDAVCALTAAFDGYTASRVEGHTRLLLVQAPPHTVYEVLDGITDSADQLEGVQSVVSRPQTQSLQEAAHKSRKGSLLLPNRELHVPDDPDFLKFIASVKPAGTRLVLDEWNWAGLTGAEIRPVLHALRDFAIYREFQYVIAAERYGLRRPPITCLVKREPLGRLADALAHLSGVDRKVVTEILSLLVYGHRTRSPDPALQPIFLDDHEEHRWLPLGLIGTSRMERNFLALAARVDQSGFNAASHVFSTEMTSRFTNRLHGHQDWIVRPKVGVPGRKDLGDNDLAIVSPRSKAVLLVELKSSLDAAEMRETLDRTSTAAKACSQHIKRIEAVRTNPSALLSAVGVPDVSGEWSVDGVVVFSAFSCGPHSGISVMSESLFLSACSHATNLRALARWIQDGSYLPRMGEEVLTSVCEKAIGRAAFQWQLIHVDINASERRLRQSLASLASMTWDAD